MVRRILLIAWLSLFVAANGATAQQRQAVGVFGLWGAFREPGRCFALAEAAASSTRGTRPFASVAYWPGAGPGGQVYLRLSQQQRAGSAVLLRIDDRTFPLTGRGWDAWATGPASDAAVVLAMRSGLVMTVETRSANGGLVRDQYRLQGAPSAIDAAALACRR
jgi:hypothetical protein